MSLSPAYRKSWVIGLAAALIIANNFLNFGIEFTEVQEVIDPILAFLAYLGVRQVPNGNS